MPLDLAGQAFTRQSIYLVGVSVTFARLFGVAPNVTSMTACVTAVVRLVLSDGEVESRTGYASSKPGSITQDDRQIIVMSDDLANAGFPVPVQKGDRVTIDETAEAFNITRVDNYKRNMTGAVEMIATGVS